jgi:hypothetical protein
LILVAGIAAVAQTAAGIASAQQTAPPDVVRVAEGWALLGKGNAGEAEAIAKSVLVEHPNSAASAALLVQAVMARSGVIAGLTAYEQWLGARKIEDAYLLRQVALAYVREAARDNRSPDVLRVAVRALSEDRDVATLTAITRAANAGGLVEMQILAGLGSPQAATRLVTELQQAPGNKGRFITAIVDARVASAGPALQAILSDPMPENKAAAADALGKLGIRDAADKIRPLLAEPMFYVKFTAAGALYRLGDATGVPLLREAEASEHAMIRVQALEALSVTPDAAWQASVRRHLQDPDPQVRLLAARLIAPYDSQAAAAALERLLVDENLAIREAAGAAFVGDVASDFPTLRKYLRGGDPLTRVRAAARILALTRL